MKAVMIVLLIFAAACLIFPAAASGSFGPMSGLGPEKPQSWLFGSDAKRMEDKMAKALSGLDALKRDDRDENKSGISDSLTDALIGASALNSSTSKDTTPDNSSLSNFSEPKATGLNLSEAGSSSKGSFNGFYGITASRHEIGKSNIKSSMFLSGGFDVEKTVQFSDQGF